MHYSHKWLFFLYVTSSSAQHAASYKTPFDYVCSTTHEICFSPVECPTFKMNRYNELTIQEVSNDYIVVYKKGYWFINKLGLFNRTNSRKYLFDAQTLNHTSDMIERLMLINYTHINRTTITRLVDHISSLYTIYIMPNGLEELNTIVRSIIGLAYSDRVFGKSIIDCKIKKRIDWRPYLSRTTLPTVVLYPTASLTIVLSLLYKLNSLFVQHNIKGSGVAPLFSHALSQALFIAQSGSNNKHSDNKIAYLYNENVNKAFFNIGALKKRLSSKDIKIFAQKIAFYDKNIIDQNTPEQQHIRSTIHDRIKKWVGTMLIRDIVDVFCALNIMPNNFESLFLSFLLNYDDRALLHELPYLEEYLLTTRCNNQQIFQALCKIILLSFPNQCQKLKQYIQGSKKD